MIKRAGKSSGDDVACMTVWSWESSSPPMAHSSLVPRRSSRKLSLLPPSHQPMFRQLQFSAS